MRKLLLFSIGFALAAALYVYLAVPLVLWAVLIGVALICLVTALFKRQELRRIAIMSFGIAVGLLWCGGYNAVIEKPAMQAVGEAVEISAEICGYPTETRYGAVVSALTDWNGHPIKTKYYLPEAAMQLQPGDRLQATARLSSAAREIGNLYNRSSGHVLTASVKAFAYTRPEKIPIWLRPVCWNRAIQERISQIFPQKSSGLVTALLTGSRTQLTVRDVTAMKRVGVYHMVAVSGMHVSVLLSAVLVLIRRHRRMAALIGLPVTVLFLAFIGGTPGVVRAGVLQSFLLLAPICRREADPPTSLGAALLLLLAVNPWAIANVGLQLSFASVSGIFLFSDRIRRKTDWLLRKIPLWTVRGVVRIGTDTIAATLGATAFTLPLSALYFGSISLIAPIGNLLVLPVVTVCFVLAMAAVLLSYLWLPLGTILAEIDTGLVSYILGTVRRLSMVPFAAVYTSSILVIAWLVFAYSVVLLCLASGKTRHPLIPVGALALSLSLVLLLNHLDNAAVNSRFLFSALDVGQGQSIAVVSGGQSALIDCGGSEDNQAAETAAAYLQRMGCRKLDYLILTHYDRDHAGGAAQLLYTVPTDKLLLPQAAKTQELAAEILNAAAEMETQVVYVTADQTAALGNGSLEIYAPVSAGEDNESGLSVLASAASFSGLVTGDMSAATERRLLRQHAIPMVDVLVAGHHGSNSATCETLLQKVKPEMIWISVGENNYGLPGTAALERMQASGAEIFRTDLDGTLITGR